MQETLLLIAASIGVAIIAIGAGVWFAGRQARRNPYARHALVREAVPAARRASTDPVASHLASRLVSPAVAGFVPPVADAAAKGRQAADGATALGSAARDAQAAAKAAVREAREADADAVDLEHRAAQAVRNARPNVSGSEALALRLQDRARRARRYATLASQWAADARNYAELAIGEPTGSHAALAIERAMQAAGAHRETQRLATRRRGRVRGLQTAER